MDDDMKELHHDNYPSQSEMQEWLEANREIYTDFKSKIQSILKNLLCDNYSKQIDDEANGKATRLWPFWPSRIVPFGYNMIDPFGQNSIDHLVHLLL